MKHLWILGLCVLLCSGAFAQSVVLDDFESGFNIADWTTGGYPTLTHVTTDGATGTSSCLNIADGGWSMNVSRDFPSVVPADGDYKITFWYRNGHADAYQDQLQVKINGIGTVSLPRAQVADWTFAETGFAYGLTAGSTVTLEILGQRDATLAQQCRFDQFVLVREVSPVEGIVHPLSGDILSNVTTLTVEPSGGSGTYTSVSFDIDDDGSVEYTDSTPADGFTYDWDTSAYTVAAASDRIAAVNVGIEITDSDSSTGALSPVYGLDNRYGGRESFVLNGGFESWTGSYPDNWVYLAADGADPANIASTTDWTVMADTTTPAVGSNALLISYPNQPDPYRYAVRTNAFAGDREEYIAQFYGKGPAGFCRVCYFQSEDGIAWISSWHLLNSNSSAAVWNEVIDAPWTPGAPVGYFSLATHAFGVGDFYWDEVRVAGSALIPTPTPTDTPVVAGTGNTWHDYR